MRTRRLRPPVLELRIEALVVDADWPHHGRDALETALRAGLGQELARIAGQTAPGSGTWAHARSQRHADQVTLSCPPASGAAATGHAAGLAIGSDLGERLGPLGRRTARQGAPS